MLKIELYNPEKKKKETITQTFVSARNLRKAVQFYTKVETEELSELEQLDELITLVADCFNDERVTFDSILDGIAADQLSKVLEGIMDQLLGGEAKKKEQAANLRKVAK